MKAWARYGVATPVLVCGVLLGSGSIAADDPGSRALAALPQLSAKPDPRARHRAPALRTGLASGLRTALPEPAGLPNGVTREAWREIRSQIEQARYAPAPSPRHGGRLVAANARQDLRFEFGDAMSVAPAGGQWRAALRTLGVGRGDRVTALGAAAPRADGNRVEYARDDVTEWFVNSAAGLEHGYTLHRRPAPRASGAVVIDLAVEGLAARSGSDGAIVLADAGGAQLHYDKLHVSDAAGRAVPAALSVVDAGRVRIAFDDAAARYPVTVDPLIHSAHVVHPDDGINSIHAMGTALALSADGQTLVAGDGWALGYGALYVYAADGAGGWALQQRLRVDDPEVGFGYAVAIDGDTIVAGSYGEGAYVFVRSAGTWTEQAKLFEAGPYGYGFAVAIAGNTAAVSAYSSGGPGNVVYVYQRSAGAWTRQQALTAPAAPAAERFGTSLALAGDRLAVGAVAPGFGNSGAAYLFTRTGGAWSQAARLTPADPLAPSFGVSVALDADSVLVGAPSTEVGGVYVYAPRSGQWLLQQKLSGSEYSFGERLAVAGTRLAVTQRLTSSVYLYAKTAGLWLPETTLTGPASRNFAYSVALAGDTLAVGQPEFSVGVGKAWVYKRQASGWIQSASLSETEGTAGDYLGYSMAVSGDTLVVGADWDDTAGGEDAGSAHVFVRSGDRWVHHARLTASDGDDWDSFGGGVAISGDTIVVGAYCDVTPAGICGGSAYVFTRTGNAWTQQAQLRPSGGADWDFCGLTVAVDGNTAVVGCDSRDTAAGDDAGAAHVFVRNGSAWTEQAQLTASDGVPHALFGYPLSLEGDTLAIGADYDAAGLPEGAGSAYVFQRSGTTWTQQARLVSPAPGVDDRFGSALALSKGRLLVSSVNDDTAAGFDAGSADVFERAGTGWAHRARLSPADAASWSYFGNGVALSGDVALVGAPGHSHGEAWGAGAAYVYLRRGDAWVQYAMVEAPDAAEFDFFGTAAAVAAGGDIAVSAGDDDTRDGQDSGSAHVFRLPLDSGDAPGPYPTAPAQDGARHVVDALRLGNAMGEDDGASFGALAQGQGGTLLATVSGGPGVVDAWIDFNADGDWADAGERVVAGVPVGVGANTLGFSVPASVAGGTTYARVRLSTNGSPLPTGLATDGEVEDLPVTLEAATPPLFTFVDVTGVDPATWVYSNTVTVTGIAAGTPISITGGYYRINAGAYTTVAGTVNPGDTVRVRHQSSYYANTTANTRLTVGGFTDTFSSTTNAKDINPDAFSFPLVTDVPRGTVVVSAVVTPVGYDAPAPVAAYPGTEYRLNGGAWTAAAGTIRPGDTLQVRHTSATTAYTVRSTTIAIGLTKSIFRTRTAP